MTKSTKSRMTAGEFIAANTDIFKGVVEEQDFDTLTDGSVLFMIITTPGQKDIENRAVHSAGYYLVVSRTTNRPGKTTELTVLGLTAGGYAKVESISLKDLEWKGNKMVFHCKPLPQNDPRSNYQFLQNKKKED